jgi:phage terminase large subunit
MRAIAHSSSKPPGRFGFISPTYTQSKDVAWEYLKSYSRPFLSETPNESELRVDLWNGSRIRLYGADNPDSLRGLGFDGLVIDESADKKFRLPRRNSPGRSTLRPGRCANSA